MFDVFLAELLILLLLFFATLRIFFTKNAKIDSAAVLAPVAFVFSLLLLYVWGADLFILLLCALSLFTFIINIRSLYRLSARLIVDHYNVRFIIPSLLTAIIALAMLLVLVIFRPVRYLPADFSVVKTKTALTGNLTSGYAVRQTLFEKSNVTGVLYAYAPAATETADSADSENPVILFVPPLPANAIQYEPYFLMLAQKGFRVLTADFYASDRRPFEHDLLNTRFFRRFYAVYISLWKPTEYEATLRHDNDYLLRGYAALANLVAYQYGATTSVYYVADNTPLDDLATLINASDQHALGYFALQHVAEYKTSGYGFLEQTEPFLAHFLGGERDSSFFIPRYVATKTLESIAQAQKLAAPVEIIKK